MRLSADPADPDYFAAKAGLCGRRVDILLNGIAQRHVEEADEERGFIVKAELDERGQLFAVGDEIARERLTGRVQIVVS